MDRYFRPLPPLSSLSIIALLGCTVGSPTDANDTEKAFPDQQGEHRHGYLAAGGTQIAPGNLPIDYVDHDGHLVYEGDILLHPSQVVDSGEASLVAYGAAISAQPSWPGGIMPYVIDAGLPNQARVRDAMAHISANTSVRFVERTNQADYVRFVKEPGCSSYVGRIGGEQLIRLADGCSTGSTIHEIGHALGLWHEQSRSDRDGHIVILFENILEGRENNFKTYTERGYPGVDLGAYDLGSIMHYPGFAFSKNEQPTILYADTAEPVVAQRDGLSTGDRRAIEKLYGDLTTTIQPDGKVCGGATSYTPPAVPAGTTSEQIGQLVRLYCAAFDRLPDSGGLVHWLRTLQSGASIQDIGYHFYRSREYANRYGGVLDVDSFVRLLYVVVLDREPDPSGAQYWARQIRAGLDRGHALVSFSESQEFRNRTAALW